MVARPARARHARPELQRHTGDSGNITLLSLAERWPPPNLEQPRGARIVAGFAPARLRNPLSGQVHDRPVRGWPARLPRPSPRRSCHHCRLSGNRRRARAPWQPRQHMWGRPSVGVPSGPGPPRSRYGSGHLRVRAGRRGTPAAEQGPATRIGRLLGLNLGVATR